MMPPRLKILFVLCISYTAIFSQNWVPGDTLFLCPGSNCITSEGVNFEKSNLFFITSNLTLTFGNISKKEVTNSGSSTCFTVEYEYLFPIGNYNPFSYIIELSDGNVLAGPVVFQESVLVFEKDCIYFEEFFTTANTFPCNDFKNDIHNSFCIGDTTTIYLRRNSFLNTTPEVDASINDIRSTLGRVIRAGNYSYDIVWEKAGNECMEFYKENKNNCASNSRYSIIVNEPKRLNIIADIEDGDTIEVGTSLKFSAKEFFIFPFNWEVSDGRHKVHENPTFKFTDEGHYSVILNKYEFTSVENGGSVHKYCSCSLPDTISFYVRNCPLIDISCTGPLCLGDTAIYYTSQMCNQYNWSVSEEGKIITGGKSKDSYIKVVWESGQEGTLGLALPSCSDFCKNFNVKIPILNPKGTIKGDTIICENDSKLYTTQNIPGTTYQWFLNDVPLNENSFQAYINFPFSNKSTIKVKYENCNLGCSGEASLQVLSLPKMSLEYFSKLQCIGSEVKITTKDTTDQTWSVLSPSGKLIYKVAKIITIPLSEIGKYKGWVIDVNQKYCNDSIPIEFTSYDVSTPTAILNQSEFCIDYPQIYSIPLLNPDEEVLWTFTEGISTKTSIKNSKSVEHKWGNILGAHIVKVQFRNRISGCLSQAISKTIFRKNNIIDGPKTTCKSDTITYTTHSGGLGSIDWYISPIEAGAIINQKDSIANVVWYIEGNHHLISKNCGLSDTINIVVHNISKPNIQYDSLICKDSKSTVNIIKKPNDILQVWKGNLAATITSNPFKLFEGEYNIVLTDTFGCIHSDSIFIKEYIIEEPKITSSEFFNSFCSIVPRPILLRIANYGNGYTYKWYKDGVLIANSNQNNVTVQDFGIYSVDIFDKNGCYAFSQPYGIYKDCGNGGGITEEIKYKYNFITCASVELEVIPPFTSTIFKWSISKGNDSYFYTGKKINHTFNEIGDYRVVITGDNNEIGYGVITIPVIPKFESPDVFCAGTNVFFKNTSTFLFDTSAYEYEWDFGDSGSGVLNKSKAFNGIHLYNKVGSFLVNLKVMHKVSNCVSEYSELIAIQNNLNISFDIPDTICFFSQPVEFSLMSSDTIDKIKWDFDTKHFDRFTSNEINPAFIYPVKGNYTIQAEVLTKIGCKTTISKNIVLGKDTTIYSIKPERPLPKCPDKLITLSINKGAKYLWEDGSTSSSIAVVNPKTYQVTIVDKFSCETKSKIDVIDDDIKTAKIWATKFETNTSLEYFEKYFDSLMICPGDRVNFNTVYNENYNYKWSINNANSNVNSFFNGIPQGKTKIELSISNKLTGCSVTVPPFIFTLRPYLFPPEFEVTEGIPCLGENNYVAIKNPDPKLTYLWSDNFVGIKRPILDQLNFSVTVQDSFGCKSGFPGSYFAKPNPIVEWLPGCYDVCFPYQACLKSNPDYTYTLIKNGTPQGQISKPFNNLVLNGPGTYSLEVKGGPCTTYTKELNLSPIALDHNVKGKVFWDVDKNNIYDPSIDSLLSSIKVWLKKGNTILDSVVTDSKGTYVKNKLGLSKMEVGIDVKSLHGFQPLFIDSLLYFQSCKDSNVVDFPVVRNCKDFEVVQHYKICPGDTLTIYGKQYYSAARDTIIMPTILGCDSVILFEISLNNKPDLTINISPTCQDLNEGSVKISNASGLKFALDQNQIFSTNIFWDKLTSGQHTLYFQDSNNCNYFKSFLISSIPEPKFQLSTDSTCINASNGKVIISSKDVGNMYKLKGVGNFNADTILNNLSASSYIVFGKNTFGCLDSQSIVIKNYINPIVKSLVNWDCTKNQSEVKFSSAQPKSFSFKVGDKFISDTLVSNLVKGKYSWPIFYKNGCNDSINFEVIERLPPSVNLEIINDCPKFGYNGRVYISTKDKDLQFSIDSLSNFTSDTSILYLHSGIHTLFIKDKLGCITSKQINILEKPALNLDLDITPGCEDLSEPKLTVKGNGAFFTVDEGENFYFANDILKLGFGVHNLSFFTDSGCWDTIKVIIPFIQKPTLSYEIKNSCDDNGLGSINITNATNGLKLSLDDNPFISSPDFEKITTGIHKLQYYADTNCIYIDTIDIKALEKPYLNVGVHASCINEGTGSLKINTSSTTNVFLNDKLITVDSIENTKAGPQKIKLITKDGCALDTTVMVPTLPPLEIIFPLYDLDCYPQNLELLPEIKSYTEPLKYLWNDSSALEKLIIKKTGNYQVTISDLCSSIDHTWDINIADDNEVLGISSFANIFSPDSKDQKNRCFNPSREINNEFTVYKFSIYDRWGNKVFTTTNSEDCWDGTFNGVRAEQDVYVYLLDFKIIYCGQLMDFHRHGDITLIR